ncbi:amidohydrolase [Spongiivirga citrea]|uniref:Amidohydrolase n=1 Tax=Spongiivirga citrea TaxID=1481457 RepID=A0A6M0CKG3_9FLAO|nr:amidohydrolase [Spongiivirga citrea]NER18351.1 amidohydrolase [Spongiivirga citrea]
MIEEIKTLRKELHQHPELSGFENQTSTRIKDFITKHHEPTFIIDKLGGNGGLAAVYDFSDKGPTIVIRCELDALPIRETNTIDYRSNIDGVSHKCGHDGHMAIVAGLIFWIKEQNFDRGKIVLLFQPAEETGKGAYAVLQDKRFQSLNPDYVFALHNIPGEPMHEIIVMDSNFSAEVQSLSIHLKGKEAHAAEPENAINPAKAISELLSALTQMNNNNPNDNDFAVLTPVHLTMGEKAYGISPAEGELHYTIRTWNTAMMDGLKAEIIKTVKTIASAHQLEYKINWFEHFPASKNDADCVNQIKKAAEQSGFNIQHRPYPFKFGEDFGWFTKDYKTGMFGLGSGLNTPALHHADYDFPEEILETGMRIFQALIGNLIKGNRD